MEQDLLQTLDESQFDRAAAILRHYALWMINVDVDGPPQPLVANVDAFDAIVAFTSKEHLTSFASAMPDLLADDGSLPAFAVEGGRVFAQLTDDLGLLLNAETDSAIVLDPDCVGEIQLHLEDPAVSPVSVHVEIPPPEQAEATSDPRAVALRQKVMSNLEQRGFHPTKWLPLSDVDRRLRPKEEIAGRLLALAGLFAWASAPEDALSSQHLQRFMSDRRLASLLTQEEHTVFELPRAEAHERHGGSVGWRLENMWPLAWTLGYERQPTIAASQIEQAVIDEILFQFVGGFDQTLDGLLEKSQLRPDSIVNALEDHFYCAHNAVRTAQSGSSDTPTVPANFDPVSHGGVIHERRHSLTWCLSAGTEWDETDLST